MGIIVVACVEPREPAAEEDWVEAEAITGSLENALIPRETEKAKILEMQLLYFSLISVTGELQYIYIYYVVPLTTGVTE